MRYDEIRSSEIISTIEQITLTIKRQFPDSGLSKISAAMEESAKKMDQNIALTLRPRIWLRAISVILTILLIICAGILLILFVQMIHNELTQRFAIEEFMQGIEAFISALVLIGGGLYFVVTSENKIRRKEALVQLNTLRAYAHVIDLHQLKKDPTISGRTKLDKKKVAEYLDYCSDLMSILGKMAAYYDMHIDDSIVRESAADVENLTTGLSRKIWQKIMTGQIIRKDHTL